MKLYNYEYLVAEIKISIISDICKGYKEATGRQVPDSIMNNLDKKTIEILLLDLEMVELILKYKPVEENNENNTFIKYFKWFETILTQELL